MYIKFHYLQGTSHKKQIEIESKLLPLCFGCFYSVYDSVGHYGYTIRCREKNIVRFARKKLVAMAFISLTAIRKIMVVNPRALDCNHISKLVEAKPKECECVPAKLALHDNITNHIPVNDDYEVLL